MSYDSAAPERPLRDLVHNLTGHRELAMLMFRREVSARFDRTSLGVWWAVLVPLASAAILWLVFSQVFSAPGGDVPYIVYVLSGVLVATFVAQGLIGVGGSVVQSAMLLRRVYVPPEILAVSSAGAATIPLAATVLALALVQLVTGAGIPWTFVLVPLPLAVLVLGVAGLGLAVAALAVRFRDAMELARIAVTLAIYMTPVFYPIAIVPDEWRFAIELNPIYHVLVIFRSLAYEASVPPWWAIVGSVTTSAGCVVLGIWAFSRARRTIGTTV